jgi:hypothetical protein
MSSPAWSVAALLLVARTSVAADCAADDPAWPPRAPPSSDVSLRRPRPRRALPRLRARRRPRAHRQW